MIFIIVHCRAQHSTDELHLTIVHSAQCRAVNKTGEARKPTEWNYGVKCYRLIHRIYLSTV